MSKKLTQERLVDELNRKAREDYLQSQIDYKEQSNYENKPRLDPVITVYGGEKIILHR